MGESTVSVEKLVFKIWSCDRKKKKIIISEPSLQKLLDAARLKGLVGSKFLVEEDGSEVDEDEILKYVTEKPLLILNQDEVWKPSEHVLNNSEVNSVWETSSSSTVSICSENITEISSLENERNEQNSLTLSPFKTNFDNFEIPWKKFPQTVIDMCEKKQKLGNNLKIVIHIIIDELRTISSHIPVKVFRDIAAKLISKYPATFMYSDMEGKPISINNSPLIASLIERNNYLNRPKNYVVQKKLNIPLRKKRLSKNFQETCVNWQGCSDNDSTKEINTTVSDYKQKLIEFSQKKTWTKQEFNEISNLMNLSYNDQREFLNNFLNTPSIKSVKENWPFLLHRFFIFKHFIKLTTIDAENVLTNFNSKVTKLIDFAHEHKSKLLAGIYDKDDPSYMGLAFITKYFNENIQFICQIFPVGTTNDEITPPGPCPWVCSVGTDVFYIYADGELVNSDSRNFQDAFVQCFCLYFILNIQYPKEASQSFEFIQRYFFDLFTEGARGRKKNITAMAKVIRFINKLQGN